MKEGRYALIVANSKYEDEKLKELTAPSRDAEDLARVLSNENIGQFEVRKLINSTYQEVREAIALFFKDKKLQDILLLYFSGHGIMDEDGMFYYATTNTNREILSATGISSEFFTNEMKNCRSRRQVLLLDCCHSGAVINDMEAKSDKTINIGQQFGGEGRFVITASDSYQYAFEYGETSIFTSVLVHGLESGEADRDNDGKVSVDELYNYIFDNVGEKTPKMTPKMSAQVKGRIHLALNLHVLPSELPQELQRAITSPLAEVRKASIVELEKLLPDEHKGLSTAAKQALENFLRDDSQMVKDAASRALNIHTTKVVYKSNKQYENCPQCGQKFNPKAKFCFNCGAFLGLKCPSCGFNCTISAQFCANCGSSLQAIQQENLNSPR